MGPQKALKLWGPGAFAPTPPLSVALFVSRKTLYILREDKYSKTCDLEKVPKAIALL